MLVGKQILGVTECRQMTLKSDCEVTLVSISPDGKHVAYFIKKRSGSECRLANCSTGRTISIMAAYADDIPPVQPPASNDLWIALDSPPIAWSPDGSLFAFQATQLIWDKDKPTDPPVDQRCIVIYSATGVFKKSFPIPDSGSALDKLLFTPDSRRLVINLSIPNLTINEKYRPLKYLIQLIDVGSDASQELLDSQTSLTDLVGFSADGSLLVVTYDGAGGLLHKIALDGSSDWKIMENAKAACLTRSDGILAITEYQGNLSVLNQMTGKKTELAVDPSVSFLLWAPNGRMILYDKSESIVDVTKMRKRDIHSLWLSCIEPGKLNSMCVALDIDGCPSCSRDCSKIAYINQGQLYVAELSLREPNLDEKLAAGIPLTEEEMKQTILDNAKHIGVGIFMYSADNNESLPLADSIAQVIHDYLPHADVFFRPGTQENIFKYIDPGVSRLDQITNPTGTIIGELDAGYAWKVALYADGHVQVLPKK